MELPVDLSRLGSSRTIMKLYEDGEMHEERDRWDNKTPDVLCKTFYEVRQFQDGPVGTHLIKRVTYNPDNGETSSARRSQQHPHGVPLREGLRRGQDVDREYHLQVEDDGSMRAGEALLDQSTERWTSISEERPEEESGEGH